MRLFVLSTVFVLAAASLGVAWALGLGLDDGHPDSGLLAHAVELAIAVSGIAGGLLWIVWRNKMP